MAILLGAFVVGLTANSSSARADRPSDLLPHVDAPLVAGTVAGVDGAPAGGAGLVAHLVVETETTEDWLPIATTTSDADGTFVMRAAVDDPRVRDQVDRGDLRIAVTTATADGLAMHVTSYDTDAARGGRWVLDPAETDHDLGTGSGTGPRAADPGRPATAGSADSHSLDSGATGGPRLHLALTPRPAPAEVDGGEVPAGARSLELPHQRPGPTDRAELGPATTGSKADGLPDYIDCFHRHGGDRNDWFVQWIDWNQLRREPVRAVYVRTRSGTAEIAFTSKRTVSMEVGWIRSGRIGGSMGYHRETSGAWGIDTTIGPWRHAYQRYEMEYMRQGLYCSQIRDGIVIRRAYQGIQRWKPERWTGGADTGRSTRSTFPARWETRTNGNLWVSRRETQYIGGGARVAGFSFRSRVSTDSSHRLTYRPRNVGGSQTLRGNDNYAIHADFIQQVSGR